MVWPNEPSSELEIEKIWLTWLPMKDCQKNNFFPGKKFFSISPHSTISRPQANSSTSSHCKCHDWLQLYGYAITRTYLQIFDLDYEVSNFGFWFRHEGAISGKWCCTRGRRGRKYYILARAYCLKIQLTKSNLSMILFIYDQIVVFLSHQHVLFYLHFPKIPGWNVGANYGWFRHGVVRFLGSEFSRFKMYEVCLFKEYVRDFNDEICELSYSFVLCGWFIN